LPDAIASASAPRDSQVNPTLKQVSVEKKELPGQLKTLESQVQASAATTAKLIDSVESFIGSANFIKGQ